MMMHSDQIEAACRRLCELRGLDPDTEVRREEHTPAHKSLSRDGAVVEYLAHRTVYMVPRWKTHVDAVTLAIVAAEFATSAKPAPDALT